VFFLLACLVLIITGIFYQFIGAKLDEKYLRPLGEIININGRSLHVVRSQSFTKGPTVILEAGNGLSSSSWMLVQPEIAKFANCVSYDRAGFGLSKKRDEIYKSLNDINDLHRLLLKLNMPKPYVLVGHSYGGMINRLYANHYPHEVAGIVLVDAYHEEQLKIVPLPSATILFLFRVMTYFGLFRLFINKLFPLPQTIPALMRKRIRAEITTYQWTDMVKNIFSNIDDNLPLFINLPVLNKPIIVISAGIHCGLELKFKKEIVELQKDLVKKSTQGKHIIAQHSAHNVPFSEPEIIVKAVYDMVHSISHKKPEIM